MFEVRFASFNAVKKVMSFKNYYPEIIKMRFHENLMFWENETARCTKLSSFIARSKNEVNYFRGRWLTVSFLIFQWSNQYTTEHLLKDRMALWIFCYSLVTNWVDELCYSFRKYSKIPSIFPFGTVLQKNCLQS